MNILLKVFAFVFLGIGAFLAYGARFIVSQMEKRSKTGSANNDVYGITLDNGNKNLTADVKTEADPDEPERIELPDKRVLNMKMAGMIFVLAGGILALIAFR